MKTYLLRENNYCVVKHCVKSLPYSFLTLTLITFNTHITHFHTPSFTYYTNYFDLYCITLSRKQSLYIIILHENRVNTHYKGCNCYTCDDLVGGSEGGNVCDGQCWECVSLTFPHYPLKKEMIKKMLCVDT